MATAALKQKATKQSFDTGIDAKGRDKVVDGLIGCLAGTYTLLVKTHVYHWNVVGTMFLPLHELTEQHYKDLFQAADEIAERIRSLGHPAPLSFDDLKSQSPVEEERVNRSAADMLEQLVEDHEAICRDMREIADVADEAGDLVTADLLTQRLAFHEKAIWMLRASQPRS